MLGHLSPFHLPQKEKNRAEHYQDGVTEYHPKVEKNSTRIATKDRTLKLHRVHEGEEIGDRLERTADERQIEPYPREPRREIGEKRAADAADLLDGKNASAQKSESNIQKRDGEKHQYRI